MEHLVLPVMPIMKEPLFSPKGMQESSRGVMMFMAAETFPISNVRHAESQRVAMPSSQTSFVSHLLPPEDFARMGILPSHPSYRAFVDGVLLPLEDDGPMPPVIIMLLPASNLDRVACLRHLGGTIYPIEAGVNMEVGGIIIDGLRRILHAKQTGSPLRASIVSAMGLPDGRNSARDLAMEALKIDLAAHPERTGHYRIGKIFRLSHLPIRDFAALTNLTPDHVRRAARLHDFAREVSVDPDYDGLTDMGLPRARAVLSRNHKGTDSMADYRAEVTRATMMCIAAEGRALATLKDVEGRSINRHPVSIGTMEAVAVKAAQALAAIEQDYFDGQKRGRAKTAAPLPAPDQIAAYAIQEGFWKAEVALDAWANVTRRGGIPYVVFERIAKLPTPQQETLFKIYGEMGTVRDADISRAQAKAKGTHKAESAILTTTGRHGATQPNGMATAKILKVGPMTTAKNLVRFMEAGTSLDFNEVEFLRLDTGEILVRPRP